MHIRFSDLKEFQLSATDETIGSVIDVLVDDQTWDVRYLVVAVTHALPQRHVLISPSAIAECDVQQRLVSTILSRQHVIDSPPLDWNQPVSRQYEEALVEFYGWPIYWLGRAVQLSPQKLESLASADVTRFVGEHDGSSNLRSANEICGYKIWSNEAPIGVMQDMIIAATPWRIEFANIRPTAGLAPKSAMISMEQIVSVDWANQQIWADLKQPIFHAVTNPLGHAHVANPPANFS